MSLLKIILISTGLIFSAIISWRKLEYGVYLIVFTLPLYLLRLKIFGVPTTVLELEIYILFFVWLIRNLTLTNQSDRSNLSEVWSALKDRKFLIPVILILLGVIISTILSSNLRVSLGILKGWFFDPLLFSFVSASTIKKKQANSPISNEISNGARNILSALAISGVLVAIISLFYYFLGNLTFDGRLKAFYLSPNHLAMYLAPCFLTVFYLIFVVSGKLAKYFWIFGMFLMAWALYLTCSYSTWLGILAGLMLFNFIFFKAKMKIWGSIGLIILIIFLFYLQSDSQKFQNLIESPRSSFQSRIMVWQSAILMIKNSPILGIGPGMFQEYYLNYQKYFPLYLEWAVPQPHNLFLAFWLQTGILGLIGFIWLIVWFFRAASKQLTTCNPVPETSSRYGAGLQLATCLTSVMVYILVHGLVDTTYWKNDLSVIFWLIISLTAISNIKN